MLMISQSCLLVQNGNISCPLLWVYDLILVLMMPFPHFLGCDLISFCPQTWYHVSNISKIPFTRFWSKNSQINLLDAIFMHLTHEVSDMKTLMNHHTFKISNVFNAAQYSRVCYVVYMLISQADKLICTGCLFFSPAIKKPLNTIVMISFCLTHEMLQLSKL